MKTIKYTICILVMIAFCTSTVFAQKCHFDVDKKDDFTGEHVRNIRVRVATYYYSWWVSLEQSRNRYNMTLEYSVAGEIKDIISKGTKILIKLDNGKVLETIINDNCVPKVKFQDPTNNNIVTTWVAKCDVNKDIIQQLSESTASKLRLNVGGKDVTSPDITSKGGKTLMESAQCLLQD